MPNSIWAMTCRLFSFCGLFPGFLRTIPLLRIILLQSELQIILVTFMKFQEFFLASTSTGQLVVNDLLGDRKYDQSISYLQTKRKIPRTLRQPEVELLTILIFCNVCTFFYCLGSVSSSCISSVSFLTSLTYLYR